MRTWSSLGNAALALVEAGDGADTIEAVLEPFTTDAFAGRIGEVFAVVPPESHPLELVLSECDADRYEGSFSLLFHAPDGRHEPQQTFRARHAELGEFDLFLVPLGPDERGMRYEAVFTSAGRSRNR